ncbi:10130_t:CDS:1, partial [Ambispora leptoticha]
IQQLKQRMEDMERHYKYVSNLSPEQTNEHIKDIKNITRKKLDMAEKAESQKKYLFQTIEALTQSKNAFLWKNRDLVKV